MDSMKTSFEYKSNNIILMTYHLYFSTQIYVQSLTQNTMGLINPVGGSSSIPSHWLHTQSSFI